MKFPPMHIHDNPAKSGAPNSLVPADRLAPHASSFSSLLRALVQSSTSPWHHFTSFMRYPVILAAHYSAHDARPSLSPIDDHELFS
jgi:hypothetical protein